MSVMCDEGVFEELVELSAHLADDNEEVAQRFLDACDTTFQFLSANPLIGSGREFEHVGLYEVRMWRVKHFEKYLIFYLPTATGIRILHILHSATDYNRAFDDE